MRRITFVLVAATMMTSTTGLAARRAKKPAKVSPRNALEADWLHQAGNKPTTDLCKKEIVWARRIAARLTAVDNKSALAKLDALEKQLSGKKASDADRDAYFAVRAAKREIMMSDPAINFDKIVLIDNPYPGNGREPGHEARHRNGFVARFGGRLVVLEGLNYDAKVRQLAPTADCGGKEASFWRPDVSTDGKKVLFCMKPSGAKSFHIYEINADGSDAKQLTRGDYDDLDPIYCPDGKIIFCTTRGNTFIRCMPYTYSFMLARCDGDGKNIYVVSRNSECDYTPSILNDGRVLYTRWEYTDKGLWRVQSLWTMHTDGTNVRHFWGNQSPYPDMLIEARAIPGSKKVIFIGAGHHMWFEGPVGIVDPREGRDYPNGVYNVTPEVRWSEVGKGPRDKAYTDKYHSSGRYAAYKTPYPLSEELFLVSARPGTRSARDPNSTRAKFNLYMMDVYGNRELIWKGKHNAYHAMPLAARKAPRQFPDLVAWPKISPAGQIQEPMKDGVLYSNNVLEGVKGLKPGDAKYVRVVEMDHKTYSTWWKTIQHDGPAVSLPAPEVVKRFVGTVPIEADGSVAFKVTPGRAIYFQLLDGQKQAIHTMRSFTGVMPGERRGCLGCHEQRHNTKNPTTAKVSSAMKKGPVTPTAPKWGRESIGYLRFAQPVFDKYCVKCHNDKKGKDGKTNPLNLTLRESNIKWRWRGSHRPADKSAFKEPYVTLVGGQVIWGKGKLTDKNPDKAPLSLSGCYVTEGYNRYTAKGQAASLRTLPPYSALSPVSKLVQNASSGKHNKVKVAPEDLARLVAWVDANGPYLGVEEIRQMYDPHFATNDIGAVPSRVRTAPIINRFNIRQDGDAKAVVGDPVYQPNSKPTTAGMKRIGG
ncbi:MAG: hypothetical protein QGG25_02530 [Phycisphaerae bacterium]|nr:hypothetical protein [Phycisphaerae bacterium]